LEYDKIRIKFEEEIGKNLRETLEGDVIGKIKREAKVEKSGNYYKYLLEGHSFKLRDKLLPGLYKPFKEVLSDNKIFTKEIAQKIAYVIRGNFVPKLYN